MTWRDYRLIGAVALLGLGLAGCVTSKGGNAAEGGGAEVVEAGPARWGPVPMAMRVYPTTRFVGDGTATGGGDDEVNGANSGAGAGAGGGGGALLEAVVELFDAMGDSIKASGTARFELYTTGQTPGVAADRLLYSWDIELNNLDDQQRFYDPITRGYQFRLKVQSPEVVRWRTLLRVSWQTVEGLRLEDELELKTTW